MFFGPSRDWGLRLPICLRLRQEVLSLDGNQRGINMVWSARDRKNWFESQTLQPNYSSEVGLRIHALNQDFTVKQYGALSINPERYPLLLLKSKQLDPKKRTVLITGGVHGYETSGVQGALAFFSGAYRKYLNRFNFICFPCISPWSYETINRWNGEAIDPNRNFFPNGPAEECNFFLNALKSFELDIFVHFDLHETTDTDNTIFRPALAARDGVPQELWPIPDGFYLVGDCANPQKEFQRAIIDSVKKVTHIAPQDQSGKILGVVAEQEGVINYAVKDLCLCAGASEAEFCTTTEVYPDSPKVSRGICIAAQVAAIEGGLQYLGEVLKE